MTTDGTKSPEGEMGSPEQSGLMQASMPTTVAVGVEASEGIGLLQEA